MLITVWCLTLKNLANTMSHFYSKSCVSYLSCDWIITIFMVDCSFLPMKTSGKQFFKKFPVPNNSLCQAYTYSISGSGQPLELSDHWGKCSWCWNTLILNLYDMRHVMFLFEKVNQVPQYMMGINYNCMVTEYTVSATLFLNNGGMLISGHRTVIWKGDNKVYFLTFCSVMLFL